MAINEDISPTFGLPLIRLTHWPHGLGWLSPIISMFFLEHIHHYICKQHHTLYTPGIGRITVVSQTNQFSHWFPVSLFDPLQLVRFIHWFPRLLGFTTGTSASTKALTCSNFSAGSSWEIRRSWKFKWQQLELHHLGFSWTLGSFDGLSGRYMEPSWTNRGDRSCLHSHTFYSWFFFASSTIGKLEDVGSFPWAWIPKWEHLKIGGHPKHGYWMWGILCFMTGYINGFVVYPILGQTHI